MGGEDEHSPPSNPDSGPGSRPLTSVRLSDERRNVTIIF